MNSNARASVIIHNDIHVHMHVSVSTDSKPTLTALWSDTSECMQHHFKEVIVRLDGILWVLMYDLIDANVSSMSQFHVRERIHGMQSTYMT